MPSHSRRRSAARGQDFAEQPVLDPYAEVGDARIVPDEYIAALRGLPLALALAERVRLVDQRPDPRGERLLLYAAGPPASRPCQ
jgi:hypothetical protein